MTSTKQALRAQMKKQRSVLSPSDWRMMSDAILKQLLQSPAYCSAEALFVYQSIGNEVDTKALIQHAWADGKTVAVPVTLSRGRMYFVPISSDTPLHKTAFGTFEPDIPFEQAMIPNESDLFLLPGLVFDTHGNRYGYGGGFYDRYLAKHPHPYPIALAFAFQVCATPLEAQAHDIPVCAMITEHHWMNCCKKPLF